MRAMQEAGLVADAHRSPAGATPAASGSVQWPDGSGEGRVAACPNCGDPGNKPLQLRARSANPDSLGWGTLLSCPTCGCGFFDPVGNPDYSADQRGGGGSLAFYLQQGAGLRGIISNLQALNRPPGTRMLEVGCGFGFGLDFARRILHWDVLGLDPSPFAADGRASLGLPIESRYLVKNDPALAGQFDVVMASEVLEHVTSPLGFLETLRTALTPGGTLVLTTPDVEAAAPGTPSGLLLPLLSVGYHAVLQSKRSLAWVLGQAGFVEVEVRQTGGASLRAVCRQDATALPNPCPTQADQYGRYLMEASAAAEPGSDLWLGLAARAYRDTVTAARQQEADGQWTILAEASVRRFGAELEAMPKAGLPPCATLTALAWREPLCLGPLLLHRAYHLLLAGSGRASVEDLFLRSAASCAALRTLLQATEADDGDAEDVGWVAQAEALICAAERGDMSVTERFAALGASPGDASARNDGRPVRTEMYRRRLFVSLVNAGQLAQAAQLADVVAAAEHDALAQRVMGDEELDVLFCAVTSELQRPDGEAARGLELLRTFRLACATARAAGRAGSAVALTGPAHDAEVLALEKLGRWADAEALRRAGPELATRVG